MAFFKRLADIVNYEHWRNNKSRGNLLTKFTLEFGVVFNEVDLFRIHSVEFVNSLCIIGILSPDKNVLGKRIVAGTDEDVTSGWKKLNGTVIQDWSMVVKDDANLDVFELMRSVQALTEQVSEKEQTVQTLIEQLAEKEQTAQTLTEHMSEKENSVQALTEHVAEKENSVQTLTAQVTERDQIVQALTTQVVELEKDVLHYAMSKSWRFTRPFRKMMRIMRKKKNA